jgi:hypothetical protein
MRRSLVLAAVVALGLVGCMRDVERGDLAVSWTIGLDRPTEAECESAGIDRVSVSLASSTHDAREEVDCSDGSALFEDIPVAGYAVRVRGLDASGCTVYGGDRAEALPGAQETGEVDVILGRLEPAGAILVGWRFEDGMMCGAHAVEQVRIQVLSDDEWVADTYVPCDAGAAELPDVPAGSIDLKLSAFEGPAELCYLVTDLPLAPCDTVSVDASLVPCL